MKKMVLIALFAFGCGSVPPEVDQEDAGEVEVVDSGCSVAVVPDAGKVVVDAGKPDHCRHHCNHCHRHGHHHHCGC